MIGAFFYLQFHSTLNRLRVRLRRLKQPKYLAGALVGTLYVYFYFFRYLFHSVPGSQRPHVFAFDLAPWELIGSFVLAIILIFGWILPNKRAALTFSEAEIAFLFPAPISRRHLIQFKLFKSQGGILFSTLILTLLSGRYGRTGAGWVHAFGWWIIFSTVNLHLLGASFVRSKWFGLDPAGRKRQAGALAGLIFAAVFVVLIAQRSWPGEFNSQQILISFGQWLQRPPWPAVLFPFRLIIRPFLAEGLTAFLAAAWPALVLMFVQYEWVVRSNVTFEEASVELSRRMAEVIAAGGSQSRRVTQPNRKPRQPPFSLAPHSPAPIAFLWKNLISANQSFTARGWIIFAVVCAGAVWWLRSGDLAAAVRAFLIGLLVITFFLFPQMLRMDFREDLPLADLLKGLPVPGWQIVLGELLAPVVIQTVVQYFLMLLLAISAAGLPNLSAHVPMAAWIGLVLLAPFLNTILFLVANAAVVLFPAWVQLGKDAARGIEATGQRLIFVFGQMLAIVLSVLPAAMAFAGAYFSFSIAGRFVGVIMGLMAAAAVLGIEIALAVGWLGRQFENLDISKELSV